MPPSPGLGPLCDHHDAEAGAERVAGADGLRHLLDVVGNLGDEHDVGPAADPGVEGDPAGVAAHHLHDHDAPVRLGGRVQPVDRVGRERHRRVEAEAVRVVP
jgi:hypothetical protein